MPRSSRGNLIRKLRFAGFALAVCASGAAVSTFDPATILEALDPATLFTTVFATRSAPGQQPPVSTEIEPQTRLPVVTDRDTSVSNDLKGARASAAAATAVRPDAADTATSPKRQRSVIQLIGAQSEPNLDAPVAEELTIPPAPVLQLYENRTAPGLVPVRPPVQVPPAEPLFDQALSDPPPPSPPVQAPPAPPPYQPQLDLPPENAFSDPADAGGPVITSVGDRVKLVARDESLAVVLGMIAEQHGLNVVSGDEVTGRLTVSLNDVPLDDALDTILTANGYTWSRHHDILMVSNIATTTRLSPTAQGRIIRVFNLNFASTARTSTA